MRPMCVPLSWRPGAVVALTCRVLQPELWDILDSSDEEDKLVGNSDAVDGFVAALPPRYELNEEGEYKTAADMRAAYSQLRYVNLTSSVGQRVSLPTMALVLTTMWLSRCPTGMC